MIAKCLVAGLLLVSISAVPVPVVSLAKTVELPKASTKFLGSDQGMDDKHVVPDRSDKAATETATGSPQKELSTADEMESALTKLMLGNSAFGATPMGGSVKQIEDILTKTMIPKVTAAHNADQKSLDKLLGEFVACGTTKKSAVNTAFPSYTSYKKDSGLHKTCRGKEAVNLASKDACLVSQHSLYNEKVLKCKAFAAVGSQFATQKNNNEIVKKAGGESDDSYIRRISSTICGKHVHGEKGHTKAAGGRGGGLKDSMLDKYLKAKEVCEAAKKAHTAKVKECKTKTTAYNSKKGQCDHLQKQMDSNSCKYAVSVKDACETYVSCYAGKKKAYLIVEEKVRKEEVDRKAEWRGLKRMNCLIKAFADGKVSGAEVDACKALTHSTKHLNIRYGKIPELQKCALPTLYPATGQYKIAEIKPLPTMAKGIASAPCQGMNAVSTEPANNSPKGAKCERMGLNGPYSAGAIVKCTGGHDVSKSLDKNSCPQGTKLFSPRSRSDWKTFFDSGLTALYAPHFIVDITRPENGCGGCKNHAMNSRSREQRSWRTSDGSAWWLRSNTYGQPSGDYHANCYLNLWHTPKNEDAVTWNDHNCNYHSKSYYCQPKNIQLTPRKGPASCRCSQVDLAGTYTAGLLVKCEECTVVSKTTQTNSCPKGMKIFSPQSRADWKTFLDSAQPLAKPNWIIDVTRPASGCGGCKGYPMNSKVPQQATWRTSDGSPWWLRSTVFNEPNGNYHANCYLALYTSFQSSDTVKFDDANCQFHSRSYYCQPTRTSKNYEGKDKILPPPPKPPAPPKPWFCVVRKEFVESKWTGKAYKRIDKLSVKGPYSSLGSAQNQLNKREGTDRNRQMICEMSAAGAKKDPHHVGGKPQGGGKKHGFNKYWQDWADIREMNKKCNSNSACKKR